MAVLRIKGKEYDISLIPSTSWYKSLANLLPKDVWRRIRNRELKRVGFKCELCGKKQSYGLNCHEVWEFDDIRKIQKLVGYRILCRPCHLLHHLGFAHVKGKFDEVKSHAINVLKIDPEEFEEFVVHVFEEWEERSAYKWKIDISFERELPKDFKIS